MQNDIVRSVVETHRNHAVIADPVVRFCGVDVEIRGASGKELRDWLWDYDAHPLAEQEHESLSSFVRTGRVGLTGAKLFTGSYPSRRGTIVIGVKV